MTLSDDMYNFNANLSLRIALDFNPDEELIMINKHIGRWIKEIRKLEDKLNKEE